MQQQTLHTHTHTHIYTYFCVLKQNTQFARYFESILESVKLVTIR